MIPALPLHGELHLGSTLPGSPWTQLDLTRMQREREPQHIRPWLYELTLCREPNFMGCTQPALLMALRFASCVSPCFLSTCYLSSTGRCSARDHNRELGPAARSPMHHGTEPDLSAAMPLPAGVAVTGLDLSPEATVNLGGRRACVSSFQVCL